MKSKGIALLTVAIVATGIFALPGSVSLFSGQHTWYDLSEPGSASGVNKVPCGKCHAEIKEEMLSDNNGAHEGLTCSMCHRAYFTGYTYARGSYNIGATGYDPTPGQEAHAASTVECMDCHAAWDPPLMNPPHSKDREYVGKCGNCHLNGNYGAGCLAAGGFGITPFGSDTGTKAAHKKFVLDSMNETLMEGANEACIACHTRIGVNITWTKNENLEFDASEDEMGEWTIPSFAAGGSDVTYVNTNNTWTNP
ncbi:hypothetical protein C5S29_10725 [ANME-1 cluster archaeon GoMg3.2]|nr:hypothetical protein [ANME-1 cluster archaeon GoMg3.2]